MAPNLSEYRQIIFSEHDIKIALKDFDERQKLHKISGPIRQFAVHNGDEALWLELKVDTQIGGRIEEVKIDGTFLGAAMLSYCFKCKIPIPKASTKTITQVKEQLAIEIRVGST